MTTFCDISHWRFAIILAVDVQDQYQLGPSKAELGSNVRTWTCTMECTLVAGPLRLEYYCYRINLFLTDINK